MENVEAFSNSDRSGTYRLLSLPASFLSTMCFNPLCEITNHRKFIRSIIKSIIRND